MSTYICISPACNSFYFAEATNNGANVIGQADLAHQIQPHQYGINPATAYLAKAVMTDTVTLQFHTQWNGSLIYAPAIYICDQNQNEVAAINLNVNPIRKGYQNIPGNILTDPFTGATTQLLVSMWSFSWSTFAASLTPGNIYYIRLDNPDATNTIKQYFSEPIFLAASRLNYWGYELGQQFTLWFGAQYFTNRMANTNVIISGWWDDYLTFSIPYNPVFYLRCEGLIEDIDMKMINIGYLMQDYVSNFITGQQVPQKQLEVGALSTGIPQYMLAMISELLIADRVFINNTGNSALGLLLPHWYKVANSNNSTLPSDFWKSKRDGAYPLISAVCPLVLGSNSQQAMVTPTIMPPGRIIDYTGDVTGG